MPEAKPQNLEDLLNKIAECDAELLRRLLEVIESIYEEGSGGNVPSVPAPGSVGEPLDVMGEDGTGSHEMISTGVSEDVRRAIREGFAEGIVREKALEWFKGLLMGLAVATGGISGGLSGLTGAAADGAATAGCTLTDAAGGAAGGVV